jgi:hypothetical protein
MSNIISTYISESTNGRAEVKQDGDSYYIDFYGHDGTLIVKESFPGKSLHYVEDAAENWSIGVKTLLG